MMAKKRGGKKSNFSKEDESKLFAFMATLLSIIGFIIALAAKKDDKYVMYYAKQSLFVFLAYLIASAIGIFPFIGDFVSTVLLIGVFILWVFSWIYALSGKMKPTPIIGEYAERVRL
jgi:uncharacterized membrane protein